MKARLIIAAASGTLFGAGLAVSGMMDPKRVRGFLDLFGAWDPTLLFVMGGAVAVMGLAWLLRRRLVHPLADDRFHVPDNRRVDLRLLAGSGLFGIGWGLAGLCPGPGLASLAVRPVEAGIFAVALLAGMTFYRIAADRS
ncbi:MAG: DUF6691 family protein [Sphingomicrobium sp.]